jgi:16S rRNA (guanine966-N2)-methyltransferase
MRIVAGELRGRKLVAPESGTTRPTTDKVREAVFNALGSLDVVDGARVADLYAGSGALGIEALSRGAEHCTFVERDRGALSAIHANIAALGLTGRSRVISGDAAKMGAGLDVDLVFADPPYDFDAWPALVAAVAAPMLVAEAPHELEAPQGWEQGRTKRYGRTWVTFLHRT